MHKHEIVYDYVQQEYFNINGERVDITYENFPCPKCQSPARLMSITCYYEAYQCQALDCWHSFEVK